MATEEGVKETNRGIELAHQSGDANEDIISTIERTVQLANAISLATQQQRTSSAQIVATMRDMVDMTRQAAAIGQQTRSTMNQLSIVAHELAASTHQFQLGESMPSVRPPAPSSSSDLLAVSPT